MAKDEQYRRMINSARWLRLRRKILSDSPLCARCGEAGLLTCAQEVHHVIPVETGFGIEEKERLMFDASNLMALCHACHVAVHTEMGRSGRAARRRRRELHAARVREAFFGETGGSPPGG
ncbi:MAG: HNH endonuclease [Bacteroides sp.]|nr:HNH endonuclease [Bacteroides sp.]